MEGFPVLPIEIARLILLETVKTRSLKRALRLRFVSQSWNREVMEAIYESGILDAHYGLERAAIWPGYLTYRVLRNGQPLCRQLRTIRRVAERVQAFRGDDRSHDALRQYVFEMCQFIPKHNRDAHVCWPWLKVPERDENINENDEIFKQTLLAAAVVVNDIDLVNQMLLVLQDSPYLISADGNEKIVPIIAYPLDIAASKGHIEVLRTLLKAIRRPNHLEIAHGDAIQCAGEGNHVEVFDLCLKAVYPHHDPDIVGSLSDITNTDLFDRILALCKDHLCHDWKIRRGEGLAELRTGILLERFNVAVRRGELAMMKHLVQLGLMPHDYATITDDKYGYSALISVAAAGGHMDTITYLLEKGSKIGSRSLEAASKHGNSDCVKLLLEHGAMDSFKPGNAVLGAISRENEPVLRILVESGLMRDDEIVRQALEITTGESLLSMTKMIKAFVS